MHDYGHRHRGVLSSRLEAGLKMVENSCVNMTDDPHLSFLPSHAVVVMHVRTLEKMLNVFYHALLTTRFTKQDRGLACRIHRLGCVLFFVVNG